MIIKPTTSTMLAVASSSLNSKIMYNGTNSAVVKNKMKLKKFSFLVSLNFVCIMLHVRMTRYRMTHEKRAM